MQSQSQSGSQPEFSNMAENVGEPSANDPQNDPSAGTVPGDPHERQARIAAEAYRIAEECGFPANSAVDHWYEAQRRLGYSGLDLAASSNGSSSERM